MVPTSTLDRTGIRSNSPHSLGDLCSTVRKGRGSVGVRERLWRVRGPGRRDNPGSQCNDSAPLPDVCSATHPSAPRERKCGLGIGRKITRGNLRDYGAVRVFSPTRCKSRLPTLVDRLLTCASSILIAAAYAISSDHTRPSTMSWTPSGRPVFTGNHPQTSIRWCSALPLRRFRNIFSHCSATG